MMKSISTSWIFFFSILFGSLCKQRPENVRELHSNSRNLIECLQNQFLLDDVCYDCHYSCKLCSDASDQSCKSCYVESNRYLSQSKCLCQSTYFNEEGETYCQKCRFPCQECNGHANNSCLSCQSNLILKQNQCVCNQYQYFDYENNTCEDCHISCQICIGPHVNQCLSCPSNSFRQLSNGQCNCQNGYYQLNQQNCLQCSQNCLTCYGSSTDHCLSCFDSHQSGSSCICEDGYFHVTEQECQKCHPTCKTCSGEYYFMCLSCNQNSTQNPSTNVCECSPGYYLSNNTCHPCNLTICETCLYESTFCLTCSSPKVANSSGVCVSCANENCDTCDQNVIGCLTCRDGKYGTSCEYNCDSNCLACDISNSTVCTKCSSSLILVGNTCQCPAGQTLVNSVCSSCSLNCALCSSGTCSKCQDGYYGSNCSLICNPICKRCYDGGCNLCRTNGHVEGTSCTCNFGYYMDSNLNCQKCHYTCNQCTDGVSCSDCGYVYRDMTGTNQCQCRSGYYDFGIQLCQSTLPNCGLWCANCVASGPTCLACQLTDTNRQNDLANQCPCNDGYFDNETMNCVACDYKCVKCTNSSSCTECKNNRNINDNCNCNAGFEEVNQICIATSATPIVVVLVSYEVFTQISYIPIQCNLINYYDKITCTCLDGYYLNQINNKCLPCDFKCLTCILTSSNCLNCGNYLVNPPNCECASGFEMKDNQCKQCESHCNYCQNGCQSCATPFIFNSIDNTCPCLSSYYNQNDRCYQCESQCAECQFQSDYCTICKFNRILPYKCICPDGTFDLGTNLACVECNKKCNTCQINPLNCILCSDHRSGPPDCSCSQGYFEDSNLNCKKCNQNCLTCEINENNCIECQTLKYGDYCENCINGYYKGYDNFCYQCSQKCKTCSFSTEDSCLSCDESKNYYLTDSQCLCIKGYYYTNFQCNPCSIEIKECQTNYCGDGIKQDEEECDDFNKINKDGCTSDCKIQSGYHCTLISNNQLDNNILFSECKQCKDNNCLICNNNSDICQICNEGYFVTKDNQCSECEQQYYINFSDHCQQCNGNSQNQCEVCYIFDYGLPQKCSYCEEYPGLYTNNQKCISKCGDGIIKLNEQCDDGNILSGDGCSSFCQIEQNYDCAKGEGSTSQCFLLDLPIATISFDKADLYSSIRLGKITFNKPMYINATIAETQWKQQIIGSPQNQYEISLDYIKYNEYFYQEIQIQIQLYETLKNIVYQIDFMEYLILANDGSQLKTKKLNYPLSNYFLVDTLTVTVSQASRKFGLIMLIILGCIALLGLLLQSLEFYWNFLDLLQMIIYLTFINIQFPYIHNQFVTLFEFAQFDFLNQIIPTSFINLAYQEETHNYPLLKDKSVEENIIYNLASIIVVYLTPFSILLFAKLFLLVLNRHVINAILSLNPNTYLGKCDIKLSVLEMLYFLLKLCVNYMKNFYYKIILRVYLSSLYDLNFAIFTVIYCSIWNDSPNIDNKIQYFLACSLIIGQFGVLFILSPSLKARKYSTREKKFDQKYGSLFEGLIIGSFYNREIAFLQPLKKMIFMASILVFYDNPLNQIGILITIQMVSTLIYLTLRPNQNIFETIKSLTNEVCLLLSLFFILFYYVQQELNYLEQQTVERVALGHIGIYLFMMVVQVAADIYQQFKVLLGRYPKLKQLCKQQKQTYESHNYYNHQQFIVITPPMVKRRRF